MSKWILVRFDDGTYTYRCKKWVTLTFKFLGKDGDVWTVPENINNLCHLSREEADMSLKKFNRNKNFDYGTPIKEE